MMRKAISLILAAFIVFVSVPFANTANAQEYKNTSVPAEVRSYAEKEALSLFINAVGKDPEGYGYTSKQEVQDVRIGEGFPVYLIDPGKLKSAQAATFKEIIKPYNQWEFIVYKGEHAVSYLRVSKSASGYELASFGGDSSAVKDALHQIPAADLGQYILVSDKADKYLVKPGSIAEELVVVASPFQQLQSFESSSTPQQSAPIIKALKQYQLGNEHSDRDGGTGLDTALGTASGQPSEGSTNNTLNAILISGAVALLCTVLLWAWMRARRQS